MVAGNPIGKLKLRVPRDRNTEFSTSLFERYQSSEKALVVARAERCVQGISTRTVKALTESLCDHSWSAPSVRSTKGLDSSVARLAYRPLVEAYPYRIPDAC